MSEIPANRVSDEGTIDHSTAQPGDDRPDYLAEGAYMIALDTETDGVDWAQGNTPFLATVSDYDRDWLYYLPNGRPRMMEHVEDGTSALRKAILAADGIVFHNASFDIHMLVKTGVVTLDEILAKEIHDTDLLARVVLGGGNAVHHAGGFGLKHLAATYVDTEAEEAKDAIRECMVSLGLIQKADQKSVPDGAFLNVWYSYRDVLEEYALKDTRYTHDLYYVLLDKATDNDLAVYEMERTLLPTIIRMEHTGTKIDRKRLDSLHKSYGEKIAVYQAELMEFNDGKPFNPSAPTELIPVLEKHGVELNLKTPTGQIRVDQWALENWRDIPVVSTLLEFRAAEKLFSTYLNPMKDRDTVHPTFWQIGARTSRMSASRPNMQNVPVRSGTEMRSMFVPRPKYALAVADYSSIELRLLAYYMADDDLWDLIESGDFFLWMGERIYGTDDQASWPVSRSNLKNGTYAILYGAGGPKLAQTIGGGMTAEEGRKLASSIKGVLGPRYRKLNSRAQQRVKNFGFVETVLKRRLPVNREKPYLGLNTVIQGSAAELMKVALIRAADALKPLKAYPILTVHDEIVVESPQEQAEDALDVLSEAMVSVSDIIEKGRLDLQVEGKVCYESYAEAK